MNMVEMITHKKLGLALTQEEITDFVQGAANNSIPEYQLAALLMAIRLNGMTAGETTALTLAMRDSPGGGLRRTRGQDERPGSGPHRRHAGQAGVHRGLPGGNGRS